MIAWAEAGGGGKAMRVVHRNRIAERCACGVLGLLTLMVVLPLVGLFGFIVANGARQIDWKFLTHSPTVVDAGGGVFPAIVGTLYVMAGTISIALPLGVAGAIYLTEYAGRSALVRIIRLAIVNLAGVPSIVHGLFGLGFFVLFVGAGIDRYVLHAARPVWGQPCLLWGFCTLAVVILPIVITTTEEALRAVPAEFRTASLSMGATRWQTVRNVVLPAALPGIMTGAVLGIGRAAGETAPVMITCAASFKPGLPQGWNDQAMLLPYHLYFVVTQVPNPSLRLEAGIALLLIMVVFATSLAAIIVRTGMRSRRRW